MKKCFFKNYWYVFILIVVMIFSCAVPTRSDDEAMDSSGSGNLYMTLNTSSLPNKTITPGIDMTPATFDIYGSGPSGASFQFLGESSGVSVTSLVVGSWTVTVNAKNAGGDTIGSGSNSVSVIANMNANVVVSVQPLSGNGTLDLTIDWSTTSITTADMAISATVTPAGGSAQAIVFSKLNQVGSHTSLKAGGYYVLAINGTYTGGQFNYIEALRIVAGETTSATLNISEDDGDLVVTIQLDMDDPIDIEISGPTQVEVGDNGVFTSTTNASSPSYQWYLDGVALAGQTASSLTYGSTLSPSNYTLTLIVHDGDVIGSDSYQFAVVDSIVPVPPYTFETNQTADWQVVSAGDQQGIISLAHDLTLGNGGSTGSMRAACNFVGPLSGSNYAKGAVLHNPATSINLTGQTITVSVYVPASLVTAGATSSYGIQIYIKSGTLWTWADGGWSNLDTAGWNTFTWNLVTTPPAAGDITDVVEIGAQISQGGASSDWSGNINFDDIDW